MSKNVKTVAIAKSLQLNFGFNRWFSTTPEGIIFAMPIIFSLQIYDFMACPSVQSPGNYTKFIKTLVTK